MNIQTKNILKKEFQNKLNEFVKNLKSYVTDSSEQWTIKGFIDVNKNIYTLSSDTKIISKILELHIFPKLLQFSRDNNYDIVLAEHQNYYPDISFIDKNNPEIKFAIDLKTTYKLEKNSEYCNGFTLGSHGEYFTNRKSSKNIQYPYGEYISHFVLGIIYSRAQLNLIDETKIFQLKYLKDIQSVISNFVFFVQEKWKIASDKTGSGNTANIGSIKYIEDLVNGNGIFKKLGEKIFDEYWMNYGKITIRKNNKIKKITSIKDYLEYRSIDSSLINQRK